VQLQRSVYLTRSSWRGGGESYDCCLLEEGKEEKEKGKLRITLLIHRLLATTSVTYLLNTFIYFYIYNQLIARGDFAQFVLLQQLA